MLPLPSSLGWRLQNKLKWQLCRLRGMRLALRIRMGGGSVGPGLHVERSICFRYPPNGTWKFGRDIYLGYGVVFDSPGTLVVGDSCRINHYTTISAIESVTIGERTLIAECCSVRDANHEISGDSIAEDGAVTSRVTIGADVWIGRGCAVLAGVEIGNGAVIGANSVVTRDIAPRVVAIGAPATPRRLLA